MEKARGGALQSVRAGRVIVALMALGFAVCASAPARAATPATDEADALFEEGRRLMDEGHLPEACAKLERSFQLAPRLGAMLNLGACNERRGQLARAIALYERAATLARQLGRPDREAAAREFAAALEGRVGKLLIVIQDPSPELVTQVDGESMSTRGGLLPLDPGHRRLVARAPGRAPFETSVDITAGKTTTVTIPKLAEEKAAPLTPASNGSTRTWVLVAGLGVTAAGVGVGSYFGLRAKSKHDDSSSSCDASGCSEQGLALLDQAKTAGNVSTVAFVVAGAALAGTIAALFLLPADGRAAPRAGVRARVLPTLGGLSLVGGF